MRSVINLDDGSAVAKMKAIAEEIGVCFFCTNIHDIPFDVRPMSVLEVDAVGDVWFFSIKDTNKNDEIQLDTKVQLLFSKPAYSDFLSVYGDAEIITNRAKLEQLWPKADKIWFSDGMDDPNLTLLRVISKGAYYWDTKQSIAQVALNSAAKALKQDKDVTEGNLLL